MRILSGSSPWVSTNSLLCLILPLDPRGNLQRALTEVACRIVPRETDEDATLVSVVQCQGMGRLTVWYWRSLTAILGRSSTNSPSTTAQLEKRRTGADVSMRQAKWSIESGDGSIPVKWRRLESQVQHTVAILVPSSVVSWCLRHKERKRSHILTDTNFASKSTLCLAI